MVSPVASTDPLITATPYQNLSTTSPTTVTVEASGLLTDSEVSIRQVEMSRESDGVTRIKQMHKAVATTDSTGAFSVQISVQYDVRSDLTFADYCLNDNSLGHLCYLHLQYQGGDNSGEVVAQPKLYFGVSAPGGETPPAGTPASKEDCKATGWQNYVDAVGQPFKNQGDCVKFAAS